MEPLPPVIDDPKDQAVIEAAVTGKAAAICTFDEHFYKPRVLAFCAANGIQVVNDARLLRLLRTRSVGPGGDS